MEPERKAKVNGHTIAEYYWNGNMVVYVDNTVTNLSWEEALDWSDKVNQK